MRHCIRSGAKAALEIREPQAGIRRDLKALTIEAAEPLSRRGLHAFPRPLAGRRNGRHVNRPGRRQAPELLVGCPDGCAEDILFANGFKRELLLDLLQLGLAYAQAERMVIDGGTTEVTRLRITGAGRDALAEAK